MQLIAIPPLAISPSTTASLDELLSEVEARYNQEYWGVAQSG
jgi:hypothetical protein